MKNINTNTVATADENATPTLSSTAATKSARLLRFQNMGAKTSTTLQPVTKTPADPVTPAPVSAPAGSELDREVAWFVIQAGGGGVNLGLVHHRVPEFSALSETDRRALVSRLKYSYNIHLESSGVVVNGKPVLSLVAHSPSPVVFRPAFFAERDEAKKRAIAEETARRKQEPAESDAQEAPAEPKVIAADDDRKSIETTADLLRHLADRLDEQAVEAEAVNERKARFDELMRKSRESSAHIQTLVSRHNTLLDELQAAADALHAS